MNHDFPTDDPEALAAMGIFSPIERRYIENSKEVYFVIPNQKILVVDPAFLKGEVGESSKYNLISRPPAFENSFRNFLQSLVNLLKGWFGWLFDRDKREPKAPVLDKENSFFWKFDTKDSKHVQFKVVRVSECPNDPSEYGYPSVSILVEWALGAVPSPAGNLLSFAGLHAQVDNQFIINPDPNNAPGWPPKRGVDADSLMVHDSDFMAFEADDRTFYTHQANVGRVSSWPTVAVIDTGIGYKWQRSEKDGSITLGREYTGDKCFYLSKNGGQCTPGAEFGYCGISDYLRKPVPAPQLSALNGLSRDIILASPYDDNLVDEIKTDQAGGVPSRQNLGRHGTSIAAILNQAECKVLPIKAFNGAGVGTLFDILGCCNYLMSRHSAQNPVKVLNASFSGLLNSSGARLLYNKLKAITVTHGIWVVAAAGNQSLDLDTDPRVANLYPAQFGRAGQPDSLDKVIVVNSRYAGNSQPTGNTGSAVAVTVASSVAGGFPSAIPTLPLQGTSFAVPFVAAALALSAPLANKAAAKSYLAANPLLGQSFQV